MGGAIACGAEKGASLEGIVAAAPCNRVTVAIRVIVASRSALRRGHADAVAVVRFLIDEIVPGFARGAPCADECRRCQQEQDHDKGRERDTAGFHFLQTEDIRHGQLIYTYKR